MRLQLTNGVFKTEEQFVCSKCGKSLTQGYVCENDHKIILCEDCQTDYPMNRCRHKTGEHAHIKWLN